LYENIKEKCMFRSNEQKDFHDRIAAHLQNPTAPLLLEGTAGLGKTRAMVLALLESGKRTAMVFPTHQLVNQFLASSDLKAALERCPATVSSFRPRKMIEECGGDYEEMKLEAATADLMLCTMSSVMIDQRLDGSYNGVSERDIILFDEADQLPSMAGLMAEFAIPKAKLTELGINQRTPIAVVDAVLKIKTLEPEVRAAAKIIKEVLRGEEVWFRKVGMTDDGGIALYHRLAGRLIKKISNRPTTVFCSATLTIGGKFQDFTRSMGITSISPLSTSIEPKHHGELIFDFCLENEIDSPEWLSLVVDQIEQSDGPTLVVTPSFALANQLGGLVCDATLRTRDETTSEAAARMGNSKILIAAGAWAGLDTPIEWSTVIVPRVPFGQPKYLADEWNEEPDEWIEKEAMASFFDSRNLATRRMKQVFGRGLRKPDAVCRVVICDPRILMLGEMVSPARFRKGWLEGRAISVTQTVSERDPRLRKDALKYYGINCAACQFVPLVPRQVEVHHKNPLADRGAGVTKMEDVCVLCRNYHGLAHTHGNDVIPLERLIEIAEVRGSGEDALPLVRMKN
jgi:Rad3-related DNA helicase